MKVKFCISFISSWKNIEVKFGVQQQLKPRKVLQNEAAREIVDSINNAS